MNIADFIDFRVGSTDHRIKEWLRKNAKRIAEDTYGEQFLTESQAKKMSNRYMSSIRFQLKGANSPGADLEIRFDVKSYKTEDGKPLWKFFEKGTKKHWIYPRVKKALRWQTGTVSGIAENTSAGDPIYAFSKGHQVRGIKARNVLYWTTKRGTKKFKRALIQQLQRFLDSTATNFGV